MEFLSESTQVARKEYSCDASYIVNNGGGFDFDMTDEERAAVEAAKANRFRIQKGETYLKQVWKDNGVPCTVRMIPAIHNICVKYELYESD